MNYSENLDKINYSTTLGTFKITDITSYYTINPTGITPDELNVSQNTTLIELANSIYSDVNKFWLFMYSNNTPNPFLLTNEDTSDLLTLYNINQAVNAKNNLNNNIFIPAGSLMFKMEANSGSTWDYGYTGNYSLTGGFALVESANSYNKTSIIKEPTKGITFAASENVVFLIKGSTSYYYYSNNVTGLTNTIQTIQKQETTTQKIVYKNANLEIYGLMEEGNALSSSTSLSGTSQAISYGEVAQTQSNLIKVYTQDQISKLNITKVTQNYIP